MSRRITISGLVVQWGEPDHLATLMTSWNEAVKHAQRRNPESNHDYELLVVDNGPAGGHEALAALLAQPEARGVRLLGDGTNLGFSGAVNLAASASQGSSLLILNPDAHPRPDALEHLTAMLSEEPTASGLVPALVHADGSSQASWQLRPLAGHGALIAQGLFLDLVHGPEQPPPAGAEIEQPAAAALVVRREVFDQVGGMDERFFPAWFEDVDLARRIARDSELGPFLYCPDAVFEHALGSSVPGLGYGRFLWAYYRNLTRYLEKHYGTFSSFLVHLLLPVTALLRCVLVPVRKPRRATSRSAAMRGLLQLAVGALTHWRLPSAFSSSLSRQSPHR